MPPLVSVIIPAYNAQSYLRATLDSVLEQTYDTLEVIVVDDGSDDDTQGIAQAYAARDARVRLLAKANGGVSSARNAGISAARGDYVAFLDADDVWHPEKIAAQMETLRPAGREAYVAAFSLHLRIDTDGRVIGKSRSWPFDEFSLPAHIVLRPVGNGSSLIVRRDVAIAAGGFDEDYVARGAGGCEDFDFELRIAAQYPIACVRQYHVGYRVYDGNMSSDSPKMARAIHETLGRHLQLHAELSGYCRKMALLKGYEYSVSILRPRSKAECLRHVQGMMAVDTRRALGFLVWDFSRRAWRALKRAVKAARGPDPFYADMSEDELRAWPDHRLDDLYNSLSKDWAPVRDRRARNFLPDAARPTVAAEASQSGRLVS